MHNRIRIAKVIIVKYFKFLVLVRSEDGRMDLPGGKLDEGEGILEGLFREISEETGLGIEWPEPVNQWILPTAKGLLNGMTFCCDYKQGRVVLSHEHTEYFWQDLKNINHFTPQTWIRGFWGMKGGIMLFDRVNPQDQFEEEPSDIEITINIECPHCKPEPEDTFPEHYIYKDFPDNYLKKQDPPESDIMFPPRIP